MNTIAVIGAGPGGLSASLMLLSNGKSVTIIDGKAPWEKPCAGVLGVNFNNFDLNLERYPFGIEYHDAVRLISPRGDIVDKKMTDPIPVVSRYDLSRFLMEQNVRLGLRLIKEDMITIDRSAGRWKLCTENESIEADIIVGADGAASITRKALAGSIQKNHLFSCYGYFVPDIKEKKFIIKFSDILGFMWVVTGKKHTSVGAAVQYGTLSSIEIYSRLDELLADQKIDRDGIRKYSHCIPSASDPSFFDKNISGSDWILVGDAAGLTGPVLGEGIFYSFESGKYAADAIISGDIGLYEKRWRSDYYDTLVDAACFRKNLLEMAEVFGNEMYGALMFTYLCNL